ncbi:MAG: hypothetical protein PSX36_11410, partial [bacterium]|nr:hypothetical protein [bacterium]
MGINFQIYGAVPPGALFYQIGCGPPIAVGSPICLNGQGPHVLTFCKPGNNINSYGIISTPRPAIPDSILVRSGCSATLAVSGFSVPTITWSSIYPGAPGAYNSYLNCSSGCATVAVTPTGTPPVYVDYLVGGNASAPCEANYYQDTVRVYFYNDLIAGINPTLSAICMGSSSAVLTATVTGGIPPYTYSWSTTSTVPSVTVGPGAYTVVVYDRTGCPPTTATAIVNQFTAAITADCGSDQLLCKINPSVSLNGIVGIAAGGIWSGGSGIFSPTNSLLATFYIPTAGEIIYGSVQLYLTTTGNSGCPAAFDTLSINFQNAPLVSAGAGQTVCANNSLVLISATVTSYSSGVIWSSTGSGAFSSVTNSNTSYTPSAGDALLGIFSVVVTTTNNGVCAAAKDTIIIIISPEPIVNAGNDQIICSTMPAILSGTVSGPTSTGVWSTTGDGSFFPGNAVLNPTYSPGPNDINIGTVTIILTSTNNGNCLPVKDTMKITVRKISLASAGNNLLLCSNSLSMALNGSVIATIPSGIWSSNGNGSFTPSNVLLFTSYIFAASDFTMGALIFTLTSTNNGPCPSVSDTLMVSFKLLETVNAGMNQFVCSSQNSITLNGVLSATNGTGNWLVNGTGVFITSSSSLSTTYSLSTNDINVGVLIFTLSSTNNGVCPIVQDTVLIIISKIATVTAGPNQLKCSNALSVALTGTVGGGTTSGFWSTNGTGTFVPATTTLNCSYLFSAADITSGLIIFTLTSNNNGACAAQSDTSLVTINYLAQVNAGLNQFICSSQNTLSLPGSISGVSGTGNWLVNGTGVFITSSS